MAVRSAARVEFLNDILVDTIEGSIDYWVEDMDANLIRPNSDASSWYYEYAKITDIDGEKHTITLETIVKGMQMIVKRNAERDKALIEANRTNGYSGDYDALDCDKIVQFALYGELMYG